MLTNFGPILSSKIKELDLDQETIAANCGMHQSGVSRLIANKTNPKLDTILRVAQGMGISASELLEGLEFVEEEE